MSDEANKKDDDDLQFDKAEYKQGDSAPTTGTCMVCNQEIMGGYYQVNEAVTCEGCKHKLEEQFGDNGPKGSMMRALAFGLPTAAFGAGVYYGISALTGYEFGLIAIVIGWLVGLAVRKASNNRGGLRFQLIAVLLTYAAISATYIPYIIEGFKYSNYEEIVSDLSPEQQQLVQNELQKESQAIGREASFTDIKKEKWDEIIGSSADSQDLISDSGEKVPITSYIVMYGIVFLIAMAAPFLSGLQNFMGLIIIAIGVWQAWSMNKKVKLSVQGPFEIKK